MVDVKDLIERLEKGAPSLHDGHAWRLLAAEAAEALSRLSVERESWRETLRKEREVFLNCTRLKDEYRERALEAERQRDEAIERAAKVCDQIRNNAERRAAEHDNGEARNSALDKMEGAIQCALAIRALKPGT